jgi:hypothetical protein
MSRAPWFGLAFVALTANVTAQGPPPQRRLPPPGGHANSSSIQPVSPVALATWKTRYDHTGQHTLDLVVVWRGQSGWYLRPGPRRSSGGSSETTFSATSEYGGVVLQLRLHVAPRVAEIQGRRVDLGDNNVVLVDSVDEPGTTQVVSLLRIDSVVPSRGTSPDIEAVLATSAEIVSFLRCDAQVPGARPFSPVSVCGRALGRDSDSRQ